MRSGVSTATIGPYVPRPQQAFSEPNAYQPGPSLLDVIQGVSVMMKGHSGQGVQDLQRILNQMGANPPLAEDGLFGPKTEAALVAFQTSAGAPNPNGRFGRDSLLAVQANRAFWNAGGFDYRKYESAIGRDGGRRAPHLGDHPAEGSLRAADLAAADQARRARTPKEAPEISNDGRTIDLHTPWYSQYDRAHVEGAGDVACYRAVRAMGRAGGINVPPGLGDRIQVATGEDRLGRVRTDAGRVGEARKYIDAQLQAGRPVAVGVSHQGTKDTGNGDPVTDHFVLITGRGTAAQGRQYYSYNDPAVMDAGQGRNNRFYVDPGSGNLVHEGAMATGYVRDRHTELSMVIRSS